MDAKERYELLKKLLEEVKAEEKYSLPVDCVLQTGSDSGRFNFTVIGRLCFDEQIISKNPIIPDVLDSGDVEVAKAEIRHIYKVLLEGILDRISGIGCERITTKQKAQERLLEGQEYKVYGTSQIPPKSILVNFGDELWRTQDGKPKA